MSLNARTTKEEEAARLEELKALEEQGGSEGYKAALVVCVNTNICGKANPTHRPGYGFAFKAIECIGVLSPSWLEQPFAGPCFIRCSRGVNARLIGDAESGIRSRDLFRLNSVSDCAKFVEEELEHTVPPDLLRAYQSYADACISLDDTFAALEGRSQAVSAGEALNQLNAAALYIEGRKAKGGIGGEEAPSVPLPEGANSVQAAALLAYAAAERRQQWADSQWTESFYGTPLEIKAAAAAAADGGDNGGTTLLGTYGRGNVLGVQIGRELRGTWSESDAGGEVVLSLSDDGLSFSGTAHMDGEDIEWTGERIAESNLASQGGSMRRWYAMVYSLRSRSHLRLKKLEEAMWDGIQAVSYCQFLPEAWEALAEAALASKDTRLAALAYTELLYLQPPKQPKLPLALQNARREQFYKLEAIRCGAFGSGSGSTLLTAAAYAMQAQAAPQPSLGAEEVDGDAKAAMALEKAIFSDDYVIADDYAMSEGVGDG